MTRCKDQEKCLEELRSFFFKRYWDKKARWPVFIDPNERRHEWSKFTHAEAVCEFKYLIYNDPAIWFDSWKVLRRYWDRLRRYRQKVREMMSERCIFVRLSWSPESLENLSAKTRHKYVSDWCAAHSDDYLANIDFGDATDREHYHVIMRYPGMLDKNNCGWDYGFVGVRYVRGSGGAAGAEIVDDEAEDSCKRLASYTTKLSFHALKDSTKFQKPIFSRKKRKLK